MIRLFLLAAATLSVVIALLVSWMRAPDPEGAPQVTRHDTTLSPANLRRAPPAAASSDRLDMQRLAESIVSEYRRPANTAPTPDNTQDPMRALTDSVLSGLGVPRTPEPQPAGLTLRALVAQSMREGHPDAYVDALLSEAGAERANTVTAADKLDPVTALNALVSQSSAPRIRPMPRPDTPAPLANVTHTAAPAALPNEAPASDAPLIYTVQPGDSLAGIALRHYGTTTAYEIIYRANRDKLPSPSAVRPGMTLTIPAL